MNQFTVSDHDGRHLGFLVMMAEDEYDEAPEAGYAAFRLLTEKQPESREARTLADASARPWLWRLEGDKVCLYDDEGTVGGHIRQQWLVLDGSRFVLGDLTGVW